MRQIEGAAQRVTKLVMERHADRAQNRSASVSATLRFFAGTDTLRVGKNLWQSLDEGTQTFLGKLGRCFGTILRVKRLRRVRDGIESTGHCHRRW